MNFSNISRQSLAQLFRIPLSAALPVLIGGCVMVEHSSLSGKKFELADSKSGVKIESALIVELTIHGQMKSGVWDFGYPHVTKIVTYNDRDGVMRSRGWAGTIGVYAKEKSTYGHIVIAKGYAPKLFFKGYFKVDDKLIWKLRPISETESQTILNDLYDQLSSPDDEFFSRTGDWDYCYAWDSDKLVKRDPVWHTISAGWKLQITPEDRSKALSFLRSNIEQPK